MSAPVQQEPLCVNLLVRQLLEGIRMVLGESGLQTALALAQLQRLKNAGVPADLGSDVSMREYAGLIAALESLTGRARRNTLRRIGRESFDWEQQHPPLLDPLAPYALRTLPHGVRMHQVLRAVAAGRRELLTGSRAEVERLGEGLIYIDYLSPSAYGRNSETPVCDVLAGYLQQAMAFAGDRPAETIQVEEIACSACGADACRFEIREAFV